MTTLESVSRLASQVVSNKNTRKFAKADIAKEVTTKAHQSGILQRPPPAELEIQRLGVREIVSQILHRRDAQDRRVYLAYRHGNTWLWQHSRFVSLAKLYTIKADYEERGRRLDLRRDGVQARIDQLEAARKKLGLGEDITLDDVGQAGV